MVRTPHKLLPSQHDERHYGHHKTAPEPRLLDDPNARSREQFGGERRGPVGRQSILDEVPEIGKCVGINIK